MPVPSASVVLAALLWRLGGCNGLMYDVVDANKIPPAECAAGCARWAQLAEDGADLPAMMTRWRLSGFTDNTLYPANQSTVDATWAAGAPPAGIGKSCAVPAWSSLVAWPPYPHEAPGTDAAFCYCADAGTSKPKSKSWGYCRSAPSVPEQINVVLGQTNSVVVSFVTLWEPGFGEALAQATAGAAGRQGGEDMAPSPEVQWCRGGGKANATNTVTTATGVTHLYQSPAPDPGNSSDPVNRYWNITARNYSFHFVKLTGLPEGEPVTYRARSSVAGQWSDYATFKAPFGPTHETPGRPGPGAISVDLFGDMGVFGWASFGTMEADLDAGRLDAVFHIGDHAYNLNSENDLRGDGYLQAYGQLVSRVPWVPIIGNHEWYDGDDAHRWLNQTNFVPLVDDGAPNSSAAAGLSATPTRPTSSNGGRDRLPKHRIPAGAASTATGPLGHTLTPSTFIGMADGSGGTESAHPPSNTSRFFSVDIGLGHFIALDSNVYVNKDDTVWAAAQLSWLAADLASVDRSKTPWVIAMAHHPLHISADDASLPASWFTSDDAEIVGIARPPKRAIDEFQAHRRNCANATGSAGADCPLTAGEAVASASQSWEVLFHQYGVDFYVAGHYHEYESLWPSTGGIPTQTNFSSPRAPIHITAGNGGAPGPDHFSSVVNHSLVNHTKLPASRRRWDGGNATANPYVAVSKSAGYLRMTLQNTTSAQVEYILAADGSVFDSFQVTQPSHGEFPNATRAASENPGPLANPPWIQLSGGDCCPGLTNCSVGNGPYAMSTGGDYPARTGPLCDKTPGCVAFGQMESFATHYYFDSVASCTAASNAAEPIAGSFECGRCPAEVLRYRSTRRVVSKLPWTCFARDTTSRTSAAASALEQPPPPLPHIPLSEFLGNWTHSGDGSTVTVTRQEAAGSTDGCNMSIAFATSCKPCCFKSGSGTVSADGRHVAVTASGAGCVRLATGLVYEGADYVNIKWTAHSPDGTTREWKDWAKPRRTAS